MTVFAGPHMEVAVNFGVFACVATWVRSHSSVSAPLPRAPNKPGRGSAGAHTTNRARPFLSSGEDRLFITPRAPHFRLLFAA